MVRRLQHGPILLGDRIGTRSVVMAGEIHDDWLGAENVQFEGAGVAVLQVGTPPSLGDAAELGVRRGEAAADRAKP